MSPSSTAEYPVALAAAFQSSKFGLHASGSQRRIVSNIVETICTSTLSIGSSLLTGKPLLAELLAA
jgi:hypothetical protein